MTKTCAARIASCFLIGACRCGKADPYNLAFGACQSRCLLCLHDLWVECCECTDLCELDSKPSGDQQAGSYSKMNRLHERRSALFPGAVAALMYEKRLHKERQSARTGRQFPLKLSSPDNGGAPTAAAQNQTGLSEMERMDLSIKVILRNKNSLPRKLVSRRPLTAYKCWRTCDAFGARRWRLYQDGCCECQQKRQRGGARESSTGSCRFIPVL